MGGGGQKIPHKRSETALKPSLHGKSTVVSRVEYLSPPNLARGPWLPAAVAEWNTR